MKKPRKLPLREAPELEHLFPARYGWGDDRGKVAPRPRPPLSPKYEFVNRILKCLRRLQEDGAILGWRWDGTDRVLYTRSPDSADRWEAVLVGAAEWAGLKPGKYPWEWSEGEWAARFGQGEVRW
jgi:hypothetical protein